MLRSAEHEMIYSPQAPFRLPTIPETTQGEIKRLLIGAASGFVATLPMTVAMQGMYDRLPWYERYPLPPTQIVSRVIEERILRRRVSNPKHSAMTFLSHFGYGTAAGTLYAALPKVGIPGIVQGAAYGLAVWGGSYLGLLPALGVMAPASQHPSRRNLLMIAAHLVWGSILGLLVDQLE